jgi:hypothetical protein
VKKSKKVKTYAWEAEGWEAQLAKLTAHKWRHGDCKQRKLKKSLYAEAQDATFSWMLH